ncbi:UDP-glucose/GDP-mannose dehydrogenase family protein [Candidatus Peregrinibacteria bacterium]|nr:UDP-glucose/GDP-mannose dehydrogenase family protein [Candidatus Peregrinibacteria bacterium]
MKIAIIGAGYVGLVSAAVFSKLGHKVCVVEKNKDRVANLKAGKAPFYEPNLPELLKEATKSGKLSVTDDYAQAIPNAEVIFICVGTPMLANGEPDLSYVFGAAKDIAHHIKNYCVVVDKSTVPVGTTEKVKKIIADATKLDFDVASCPEFLREGSAIENTLNPDRIVIGTDSKRARDILLEVHGKLPGERVTTDIRTAEIIKYASNAFLATKISFINEIANLCDEVGANVDDVAVGMGLDPRIGKAFLKAGIGYGGSCFPKDTKALHHMALSKDYNFKLLRAVIEVNGSQRRKFMGTIRNKLGDLNEKNIGVLGLAFKNNTDDVRESAALDIISWLTKEGAKVKGYDPEAMPNAKKALPALTTVNKAEDVAVDADAILILTEWSKFVDLNWAEMRRKVKNPVILDGRNLLNSVKMRKLGFKYYSVGRP